MKSFIKTAFIAAMLLGAGTGAYAHEDHHPSAAASENMSDAMATGVVKKVDKNTGKLTIKHGPLKNVGMGAMTMAFRVKDPAMLDQVQAGDNIQFVVEESNGQITVTQLEKQK